MSTDAFTGKSSAKERIRNAIFGLILAIGAYTILYTVNPKLVDFNIKLNNVGITTPIGNNLGGNGQLNPVDAFICTQNVPCIDVTLEDGTQCTKEKPCVEGYRRCTDCQIINASYPVPHKPNHLLCLPPHACQIETDLSIKLKAVLTRTTAIGINWEITEAFPPTVPHVSACHNNITKAGKCVDAALRTAQGLPLSATNDPNAGMKIVAFSVALEEQGIMSFQWEASNSAQVELWKSLINKWFIDNATTPAAQNLGPKKASVLNRFVPNGCSSCALHVHINSPTLNQ